MGVLHGRHGSEIYPSDRETSLTLFNKYVSANGWHFWDSQLVQTVLIEGLTRLRLPTYPLLPTHPYNMPTVILLWFSKKMLKIQQHKLEIVIKCWLKDCSSYTVYLAQLQSSTKELQWLEYLKSVFLKIPNVTTQLVFQNQVTNNRLNTNYFLHILHTYSSCQIEVRTCINRTWTLSTIKIILNYSVCVPILKHCYVILRIDLMWATCASTPTLKLYY